MKSSDKVATFFKKTSTVEEWQTCIGVVIKPLPELTIDILNGKHRLYPRMLYMNNRLFPDYTREYDIDGEIKDITINATTQNLPDAKNLQNPHGTIQGSGKYKSVGTIINTDTLEVGDLVKVTPTENGQIWIVDCKVRKI